MRELDIQTSITEALQAFAPPGTPVLIEHPADLANGDYSCNIAFLLSKKTGKKPIEIAKEIVSTIPSINYVDRIEVAAPGFINFFLSEEFFLKSIDYINTHSEAWGNGEIFKGEHHLIEHSSPNLFKPFHIGHLVNNAIGESVVRLTESQGAKVTRLSWPSDVSPGIAKALWGLSDMGRTDSFTIEDLGEAYVRGTRAYEIPEAKAEIDDINKQIYTKTLGPYLTMYNQGKQISLEYFLSITQQLGSTFDHLFFESEAEPVGVEIVRSNSPAVFEESDGAIIYRGSEDNLYDSVFINNQGFGTYLAKDLGLIQLKEREYDFDKSVTITDIQQKSHFDLVVSAMKKIDPEVVGKISYIQHGRLRFASGKISSRLGNVPLAATILEEVKSELEANAASRMEEDTLKKVAVAAVKYAILRVSPGKNMIFDPKQSLSLEGDSGLYLQYTYARISSVLSKASDIDETATAPPKLLESNLEKLLYRFPEIVERAAGSYEPHHLIQYVTSVCGEFNSWYAAEPILGREDTSIRLNLVRATSVTLEKALTLLGMEPVERV